MDKEEKAMFDDLDAVDSATSTSTHSVSEVKQSYQTDKSYAVTNQEFLENVFGVKDTQERPLLVSFNGDPAKAKGNAWSGDAWGKQECHLSPQANNYFSIASFRPDDKGGYRRTKSNFSALYAIVLDDVGVKVKVDRLTLAPSWLLETSQGNYQAGYILSSPLTDAVSADRLMKAIIAAGLSDPGAGGPTARLVRLPEGVNGKRGLKFVCQMRIWNPDIFYTPQELVDGLQLDMRSEERPKVRGKSSPCGDGNQIFLPAPETNVVLFELNERGLYKAALGNGRHDMTCPWVEEHTDKIDGGTAYFEPDDEWPLGGFKCQHGHCSNRHISKLLEFLGVDVSAARMQPTIRVLPGEMHRIAEASETVLAKTGQYYQRGGLIVTVQTDPSTKEIVVKDINLPSLTAAMARTIYWERMDARTKDWVRIDPPGRHASVLLEAQKYNHLPVLNGLARQPYFRPDGSLVNTAGYDPEAGMLGVFSASDFLVPENPSKTQAMASLKILTGLLKEFQFAKPTDKAASLSAILAASIRSTLRFAPLFHILAAQIGSGKSYLCALISAFATAQRGAPTSFPQSDEECHKLLLAAFLSAPAVIEFDNLNSDLVAHKSLCTALTSEFLTGRILSLSKTATVGTRALFLSSGNNVRPVQDMVRRCLTITLDPACEIPAMRTFETPDLVQNVLANRGHYVSAALTIIRAWISAGSPKTECPPLVGYNEWSDLCRQPLLWLGQSDPAASIFEAMADDPDRDLLGRFLKAWHGSFEHKPTMVREVITYIEKTMFSDLDAADCPSDAQELHEVIDLIAGERKGINPNRLGNWIKRRAGRIVNGMRFVSPEGNRSANAWSVQWVSPVK